MRSFANWLRSVNYHVNRDLFVDLADLPDVVDWYPLYEAGHSPSTAAAIAYNGPLADIISEFATDGRDW